MNARAARPKLNASERWIAAAAAISILILWEVQSKNNPTTALFLPAPTDILARLWTSLASGELLDDTRLTVTRLLLGFLAGAIPGMLLGLAMGWSRRLNAALDPIIAALHPIPKISLLPLIIIIFGIGEISKVVSIAVGTFFPMLLNSAAGVRGISPTYFEVAQNYGAKGLKVFSKIVLPGSLPLVLTGARISLNTALLITVAVELISSQEGLGSIIWLAWQTLQTERLYVALIVIALLGILSNWLLTRIKYALVPWDEEP